jgi:hypothetical protein
MLRRLSGALVKGYNQPGLPFQEEVENQLSALAHIYSSSVLLNMPIG